MVELIHFNKILDDLENIKVKLEEEDKTLLLLNDVPKTYKQFKNTLLFRKEQTITLEEVQTSIMSKELQKFQDSKGEENGLNLNVSKSKGKKEKKSNGKKAKQFSLDDLAKVECYNCHKKCHFKSSCQNKKRNEKGEKPHLKSTNIVVAFDSYDSIGVLVVFASDTLKSWVIDSGCIYHMCPVKEFFETDLET